MEGDIPLRLEEFSNCISVAVAVIPAALEYRERGVPVEVWRWRLLTWALPGSHKECLLGSRLICWVKVAFILDKVGIVCGDTIQPGLDQGQ